MHPTLQDSPRYRAFTRDRNKALEKIHQHAQRDLSRILFETLEMIEHLSASLALRAGGAHLTQQLSVHFENGTRDIMAKAFPIFVRRIWNMRRALFVLTYASEQEAIGRATQRSKPQTRQEFQRKLHAALSAPSLLGPIDKRAWLALMALRHRIVHAFELAVSQELKPNEIVQKVKDSFPPVQIYKRPPRDLPRVLEAKYEVGNKAFANFGFIDSADWDLAVDAYKDTEFPPNRFDTQPLADFGEDGTMKYQWELEQETTEDFVRAVRGGQVQAANDLGIKEFVWVSIIDDKTCDTCCLPRNGMTSKEIETALGNGKLTDDCDAIVPPGHFRCRCDASPVASTDEVQGPDWQSFDDWLEAA